MSNGSNGNRPRINVRELGVTSTARAERKLDAALGLGSMVAASCSRCRGELEFGTDTLGRSVERCRVCGHQGPLAPPSARPDGDRYNAVVRTSAPRREPRRHPDATNDPDVRQLRAARAARVDAPMSADLADAKRAFDALEADIKAARKGGRPRNPFTVGRQGRPKRGGPIVILDEPDAPGGAAVGPAAHGPPATPVLTSVPVAPVRSTPSPSTPMAFAPKSCSSCSTEFIPRGGNSKRCDACQKAAGVPASRQARSPRAGKARRAKPVRRAPGKRVATAYRAPKDAGGISSAIGHLKIELESLDARRDQLVSMINQLEAFETETAAA